MKKCIYFGLAEDFWWPQRFKEFMKSLEYIEPLIKVNSPTAEALNFPIVYYSHKHNVILKYQKEQTFQEEPYHTQGGSPGLIRARVNLFGKDEKDIEDLEWFIKEEAKRYVGIDNIKKII